MKKKINARVIIIDMIFAVMSFAEFRDAADSPAESLSRSNGFFMGTVYLLIALLIAVMLTVNSKRTKRLVNKGKCVRAEFSYLETVKEYRTHLINYTIHLRYENPASGIEYKFKTELVLHHDPTMFLREKGLPVYMDGDKPWNYYVDVTELLENEKISADKSNRY